MSYGVNQPQGLQAVRSLSGSLFNSAIQTLSIANSSAAASTAPALFNGDLVQRVNTGTIAIGAASTTGVGVFQSCFYTDATNTIQKRPYWPGNTAIASNTIVTANVSVDPYTVYDVQTYGATGGGPLLATNVFGSYNCDFTQAGSTITGLSGVTLNLTTSNNAADNVTVIGLTPNENNQFGIQYNNALVTINNHFLKAGIAGI